MGLQVVRPGAFTTIQDFGRIKYQHSGFSEAGAMDHYALEIANRLVNNPIDEAGIEMMLTGGSYFFDEPAIIAMTGGDCQPHLNGKKIPMYQGVMVQAGDQLTTKAIKNGRFSYLALAGGFDLPIVMGSRSTSTRYLVGGFEGKPLQAGDELAFRQKIDLDQPHVLRKWAKIIRTDQINELTLRVVMGPHIDMFSADQVKRFFGGSYQISRQADRMGYRLKGTRLETEMQANMLSEGTVFGAIQVPPEGQPIVLLADRQTTGGYPIIGVVCTADLGKLVQCPDRCIIKFKMITVKQAQTLIRKQKENIRVTIEEMGTTTVEPTDDLSFTDVKELIEAIDLTQLTLFDYRNHKSKITLKKHSR
ncbi:biotin-dependent carboxyltransferase family protein [Amphibacillus jilinensis]|uniref:5-oxoprolinase subunit C family protein n=1 Tax=Amphibacillus jilinensis TaxID=1216008 RepID=UPI000312CDC7|nr:biotin-dependent carboxyltransferase family protein [Amphibacillus jilinensis]